MKSQWRACPGNQGWPEFRMMMSGFNAAGPAGASGISR